MEAKKVHFCKIKKLKNKNKIRYINENERNTQTKKLKDEKEENIIE